MTVLGTAGLLPSTVRGTFTSSENEEPLRVFSSHEHRLLRAVAQRIVGIGPEEGPRSAAIDVAGRTDTFLATEDPEIQTQIHLLLPIFGSRLFAFIFDFRVSPFLQMAPAHQDSYIEDWITSLLEFRRKKPADLTNEAVQPKSDGSMFLTMSNGIFNAENSLFPDVEFSGQCPPLNENLTVRERWDVVNYLRTLKAQ